MDDQFEKLLAEQKKLAASYKRLKRWLIALTVALVVVAAVEYKWEMAFEAQKAELRDYLYANPMQVTPPWDAQSPTKGATFPVYKFTP